MTVLGKKFANGPEEDSDPVPFGPNTINPDKIDTRIEHRQARLKFESNEVDGNYELGRILMTVELGDERP
jgi:hypothetical protein